MSVTTTSFKLIIAMMVLVSVKLTMTESTANQNEIDPQFGMINSDEANKFDQKILELIEKKLKEIGKHDIVSKLNLFEALAENLDHENINPNKRSGKGKNSEKKRPGWELAYGKRKRSVA